MFQKVVCRCTRSSISPPPRVRKPKYPRQYEEEEETVPPQQQNELLAANPDKSRKLTYDLAAHVAPPTLGSMLVSISKETTPGSVYQVVKVRKVQSEQHPFRYVLHVLRAPELLQHVVMKGQRVYVRGKQAYSLRWCSRKKKA